MVATSSNAGKPKSWHHRVNVCSCWSAGRESTMSRSRSWPLKTACMVSGAGRRAARGSAS
eukprot:717816-Lingulodinium_polyedra.AAC.1